VSGKAKVTQGARKSDHEFAGDIAAQRARMEQLSGNNGSLNEVKSGTV